MNGKVLTVFLLALLLQSCTRPLSSESFVKKSDAVSGVFEFPLDLSDTTGVYDIYLFTRVDRSAALGLDSRIPQKIDIRWVSPAGKIWDESVYMDMGDFRGARQLYRKGLVPAEDGQWTLKIRPEEVPSSFRGIGVICEWNGTR